MRAQSGLKGFFCCSHRAGDARAARMQSPAPGHAPGAIVGIVRNPERFPCRARR